MNFITAKKTITTQDIIQENKRKEAEIAEKQRILDEQAEFYINIIKKIVKYKHFKWIALVFMATVFLLKTCHKETAPTGPSNIEIAKEESKPKTTYLDPLEYVKLIDQTPELIHVEFKYKHFGNYVFELNDDICRYVFRNLPQDISSGLLKVTVIMETSESDSYSNATTNNNDKSLVAYWKVEDAKHFNCAGYPDIFSQIVVNPKLFKKQVVVINPLFREIRQDCQKETEKRAICESMVIKNPDLF